MKLSVTFSSEAWAEYLHWGETDDLGLRKLNALIGDISRTPYRGLGQPEMLSGNLAGWASRRITGKHRLVYRVKAGVIEIAQCYGHYADH